MRLRASCVPALLFSLLLSIGSAVAETADPPVNPAEIDALVEQLGSEDPTLREAATEKLRAIGRPAQEALQELARFGNVEAKFRARRILWYIEHSDFLARQAALEKRLAAFIADKDGKQDHGLPAWKSFEKVVGNSPTSRQLFVKMFRAEKMLLDTLEHKPEVVSPMIVSRIQELRSSSGGLFRTTARKPMSLGSIAAMLLAAGDERVTSDRGVDSSLYSISYQSSFYRAMRSGPEKPLLAKLLGTWIKRSTASYQTIMLALRYDIKEGIYPAERLLSDPAANVYYRQYAMLTIAKIGNKKEHLSLVEKHIGDDMFVGTHRVNGKSFRIKLGDVALACALHMTGQNLKDYGFNNVVRNNQYLFQPNTMSFPTEAARKKAEAKWRAYKAKQAG